MDTEIEFLRRFEGELTMRAQADAGRASAPKPKQRDPHRWRPWIAAAASLLALAALIGLLAGGISNNASEFASVGSAVGAPGFNDQTSGNQLGLNPGTNAHPPANEAVPGPPAADGGTAGAPSASPAPDLQQTHAGTSASEQTDLSKIIRDGQIAVTIDTGTFKAKAGSVAHIAAVNGGSILSSSTEGGDSGSFTIRVPAANFDRATVQLAQLGSVDSSASQGQDVTAQYIDLKAHMKIYLSRRKVLFGLMDKATTIGQSLTLQNQLDQVQLKIDQITGQINYINNQVAESTIKVDLHEPGAAAAQSPDTVDNPSLGHAWDRAVQGLLNVIAATLIGLGYLIPLLIIAGIVFVIVRLARRRRMPVENV
ncbi:MAG TPA: DUF4349 domain-containing protein [Actinomycetota bacterium]|nr:DUF4349 domain-containing protein [Actinomycetota bacterium]